MTELYEAKVYTVEEIDVSGKELKDWKFFEDTSFRAGRIYIEDYLGNAKHITMPKSINGKDVYGLSSFGLKECKAETVEIPGTYKTLGHSLAFQNNNIKKVVVGEGVTAVCDGFFFNAKNLEEAYISKSVSDVEFESDVSNTILVGTKWYNNSGANIIGTIYLSYRGEEKTISIPHGITTINAEALMWNDYVETVCVPDTVKTILGKAFMNSHVKKINLPSTLEKICEDAFRNTPLYESFDKKDIIIDNYFIKCNSNSSTYSIQNGISIIASGAFRLNDKLERVVIPSSVTQIGDLAFNGCKKLKEVNLPDSLIEIGNNAFNSCENLSAIELPDSISVLGRGCFAFCKSLKTIKLPSKLIALKKGAFTHCEALSSVNVNNAALTEIGEEAFAECSNLIDFLIPNTVEEIGSSAFSNCKSLVEISIPERVKHIRFATFSGCSSLKTVNVLGNLEMIADRAFQRCNALEKIKIATRVMNYAFCSCSSLKELEFDPDMKSISYSTFEDCTSLEEIILPTGLESIERQAFRGCSSLKSVTIPDSVTTIEDEAFKDCTALNEVQQPETYKSFGVDVFTNTPYLKEAFGDEVIQGKKLVKYLGSEKSYSVPDSVEIIGTSAFAEAKQIEKLIIPDSVVEIEDAIFGRNIYDFDKESIPHLKELFIGNSVKKIGNNAFSSCKLTKASFGNNIEYIGNEAFANCDLPELPDFKQMKSLRYIGKRAFSIGNYGRYLYDRIELPRSIKTVERSAFLGTRELVVYDSIDPNAEEAEKWKYDKWNGTVNSPLSCAMLSLSDGYVECQGNTNWYDYIITVKSAKDDSIKYKIYCDSDIDLHSDEYRSLMFSAWGKHASFKFEDYDEFFKYVNLQESKLRMAFCRLSFPHKLTEEHKKQYEAFVIRCLYIERSVKKIASYIGDLDDVDALKFLDEYRTITKRNYAWIMKELKEQKASKCIEYLKSCKVDN